MWFSKKTEPPKKVTPPVAKSISALPIPPAPKEEKPMTEENAALIAKTLARLMRGEDEN